MDDNEMIIGQWYLISQYGLSYYIKAKLVEKYPNKMGDFKFYWGAPFRTRQTVDYNRIIGKCNKPSLFSNK